MNKIIYPTPEGGVAVIIPAESVELALKDVPEGVSYEIVDEADIPGRFNTHSDFLQHYTSL
jgi:hypothetical protein